MLEVAAHSISQDIRLVMFSTTRTLQNLATRVEHLVFSMERIRHFAALTVAVVFAPAKCQRISSGAAVVPQKIICCPS